LAGDLESREAKHGEKMIELKIRFWTDDLTERRGTIRPKHAWAAGVVRMAPNRAHGIKPKNPRPFNSFADLQVIVERVLIDHGVKLHLSPPMRKYLESEKN
jgi:hypothetical protein